MKTAPGHHSDLGRRDPSANRGNGTTDLKRLRGAHRHVCGNSEGQLHFSCRSDPCDLRRRFPSKSISCRSPATAMRRRRRARFTLKRIWRYSIDGKDVIIVEDIVDTGLTLLHVYNILSARGARSLRVATLLEKPGNSKYDRPLDYVGFQDSEQVRRRLRSRLRATAIAIFPTFVF